MKTVFMGTPEFAVPSLEAMIRAGYTPALVATGPDRPRGRGQQVSRTPVKKAADAHELPVVQPESVRDPAFAGDIEALAPDLIVVVAYRILPPGVFTRAKLGAFNLHASLLPAFRGAAPINRAIMAGADETGVTTFFLEEAVDTGPIILQKRTPIDPDETAGELHDRLKLMGADAVVETIRQIEEDAVEPVPQNDSRASAAPKIHTEDCRIPWQKPTRAVHDHIRGVSPYPGAWTMHGTTRLKINRSRAADETNNAPPGTVLSIDPRLRVACGDGTVELTELQQPGGSVLGAADFLNGYELKVGDVLK